MHLGFTGTILLRLLIAAGLGGLIGLERELRRKPSGLRTSMCICLGSALFCVMSNEVARAFNDTTPTRIVSNLIPGIGFLGAGAILRERGSVVGLTSAATIFVLAGMGLAIGAGFIWVGVATTILLLTILLPLGILEDRLSLKGTVSTFRVTVPSAPDAMDKLHEAVDASGVFVQHLQVHTSGGNVVMEFDAEANHHHRVLLMKQFATRGWKAEMTAPVPRE